MKYWLYAAILAFVLSIAGIGESQIESRFPVLNKEKIVSVRVLTCPTSLVIATDYIYERDIIFVSLESEGILFAIAKFENRKYVGTFVLLPNKSVVFYSADEDAKTPRVCESLEALNKNVF